ncbi:MAG: LarC family nickel insertion protein [Usitatibacter sp.]
MAPLARIHLDPIGGIAGDMFVAAMADAFPERVPGLLAELGKLQAKGGGRIRFEPCSEMLAGKRFVVEPGGHSHHHATHLAIRAQLQAAGLDPGVLRHALALFALLAQAEGEVHGVAPDEVEFHEVGAWDSIVDFVATAYFIATIAPERWTCAPLPLGGGRVHTAHGVLPIPAPATARLMEGLEVIDDGIGGERVTPTGAAIVRYLTRNRGQTPMSHLTRNRGQTPMSRPPENRGLTPVVVAATGQGFGTRKLAGIPNMLRVVAFTRSHALPARPDEEIAMLQFEIDDQTAEDLAVALDRVRQAPGVLDVGQVAMYGKKNRLATQVQILARIEAVEAVAELCLAQTTTLGLRISRVWRRTALRAQVETSVPENVRVKIAARPSGEITAKAEMDDLARIPGARAEREAARRRAETQALDAASPYERDRED